MGTGFTIDTPIKVAKYGISSVISLVDDVLIEQLRKFHAERTGEPYEEITNQDEDPRARRITLYLNLLNRLVQRQVKELKEQPFSPGSDIVRYFELLPDSEPRRLYEKMLAEENRESKAEMQQLLRTFVVPGSIDVNIMTKLDREYFRGDVKLPHEFADALAAFRGFALSELRSSIVFSAGMNQRLFGYINQFEDFFPDSNGRFKKKVILKVSDFRSSEVQGLFLAKRGIWISEHRIESGLNCGGHAFPTAGNLAGPILEQFKEKKTELIDKLFQSFNKGLAAGDRDILDQPPEVKFTVQGGICSYAENEVLLDYYDMDGTGWGTPWLLVPEVTGVDETHLALLSEATEDDVFLSESSPVGVPFWNLHSCTSETARLKRIDAGKPGSPCPQGYLVSNTEFTKKPICVASRAYQKLKLESLDDEDHTKEQLAFLKENMLAKSCICHDLGGSVKIKNGIELDVTPVVCCGPNIVDFSRIATLEEMISHIYGKANLLISSDRPHMFIRELKLYIDFLHDEMVRFSLNLSNRKQRYLVKFKENLLDGIEYYQRLHNLLIKDDRKNSFLDELSSLKISLNALDPDSIGPSRTLNVPQSNSS